MAFVLFYALAAWCTMKKLEVSNVSEICLVCVIGWGKSTAVWFVNVVRYMNNLERECRSSDKVALREIYSLNSVYILHGWAEVYSVPALPLGELGACLWKCSSISDRAGPSRCRAQCKTWARGPMQVLSAGPLWAGILWRHRVQSTVLRSW